MFNPANFPQRRPQAASQQGMISIEQHNRVVNALKNQSAKTVVGVLEKLGTGIADLLEGIMAELESKPIPTPDIDLRSPNAADTTPNSGIASHVVKPEFSVSYWGGEEYVQNGLAPSASVHPALRPVRAVAPEVDKSAIADAMSHLSPEIKEALREMLANEAPIQRTVIVESSGPIPGMFGFGEGF